ncbi:hypothetical protein SAMN02745225_01035 [Ferrithrix thermotolerans DSM 19514]|uniref:Uncharacterized protein n=2 Tax=Ferrithrix TaxID=643949 RepID=A0A1M4UMI3_9ACTN|nr:hypothetical protein SAMN02745225_01035 [Ferrithrix thermotolerans DSM 19514]
MWSRVVEDDDDAYMLDYLALGSIERSLALIDVWAGREYLIPGQP